MTCATQKNVEGIGNLFLVVPDTDFHDFMKLNKTFPNDDASSFGKVLL
jgi:hypothetical protein